ncbi:hypothetical protein [Duganella hordei]|uniref:hypothetical protein n=1 Tax=Duganella hordei TaxID=2865934 RepID=UPI00333EDDEC
MKCFSPGNLTDRSNRRQRFFGVEPEFQRRVHCFGQVLHAAVAAQPLDQPEQGISRELHAHCGKHSAFSSLFFTFHFFRPQILEEVQKAR